MLIPRIIKKTGYFQEKKKQVNSINKKYIHFKNKKIGEY